MELDIVASVVVYRILKIQQINKQKEKEFFLLVINKSC
jgi:hypothetical protein